MPVYPLRHLATVHAVFTFNDNAFFNCLVQNPVRQNSFWIFFLSILIVLFLPSPITRWIVFFELAHELLLPLMLKFKRNKPIRLVGIMTAVENVLFSSYVQ